MKKIVSILLILVMISALTLPIFAEDGYSGITDISIRPKHEKAMPGSDSLYYGYLTLNNTFDKNIYEYTAEVGYDTPSVRVEVSNTENATVTGEKEYDLNVGLNTIKVTAALPDGTQKTYTIVIKRAQDPYTDCDIKKLSCGGDKDNSETKISPEFDPDITTYNVTVSNKNDEIGFGYDTVSDNFSKDYKIKPGDNKIEITIKSQSGRTKTYTFNVIRQRSSDTSLLWLTINGKQVSPNENGIFTMDVLYDTSSITIGAATFDEEVQFQGGGLRNLKVGKNQIPITAIAGNGNKKIYTLIVNRAKPSTKLRMLCINEYHCGVDSSTYTLEMPNSVSKATIAAEPEDVSAKVTGNGTYKLKVGKNKFYITVTAADKTKKKYTVEITRSKQKKVVINIQWKIIVD